MKLHLTPILGLLAPPLLCTVASAQQPEFPVPVVEQAQSILLNYGQYTTGASIESGVDIDSFEFLGNQGDQVRFALKATSGYLDPHLEVIDLSTGKWIVNTACSPTGCGVLTTIPLESSGPHHILVSDLGADNTGGYTLQLEVIPPIVNPAGLAYGVPVSDAIGHVTDLDFFQFEGAASTFVRLTLSATSGYLDPLLRVWDPAGAEVLSQYCTTTGCKLQEDLNLTMSGTYLVLVSDQGIDNTGNYDLGLDCLIGPCPVSAQGLTADLTQISLAAGGTQTLCLDAGTSHAGETYLILGTTAGFTPGFFLDNERVPLNIDGAAGYFVYTLTNPNSPPLANAIGFLNPDGKGAACSTVTIPAGLDPGFAGLVLTHAAVAVGFVGPGVPMVSYSSNPVSLTLVP